MPRYPIGPAALELIRGDIVAQTTDAIVNAANERLAAGGGVCGAIFAAAGHRRLAAACRPLAPCPTGEARITPGFALPARHIIHAVGPVYRRADLAGSAALLAGAYRRSSYLEPATVQGKSISPLSLITLHLPWSRLAHVLLSPCVASQLSLPSDECFQFSSSDWQRMDRSILRSRKHGKQ